MANEEEVFKHTFYLALLIYLTSELAATILEHQQPNVSHILRVGSSFCALMMGVVSIVRGVTSRDGADKRMDQIYEGIVYSILSSLLLGVHVAKITKPDDDDCAKEKEPPNKTTQLFATIILPAIAGILYLLFIGLRHY